MIGIGIIAKDRKMSKIELLLLQKLHSSRRDRYIYIICIIYVCLYICIYTYVYIMHIDMYVYTYI